MLRYVNGALVTLTPEEISARQAEEAAFTQPVPRTITRRQFAHGLWKQGLATLAEVKAFVKRGEFPASLQALVDGLPVEQRDDAEILIAGAVIFERDHPLTAALAASFGWTSQQTDDFWRFCAAL